MRDTLTAWVNTQVPISHLRGALLNVLRPLVDRYSTQTLKAGQLTIKASGSPLAKIGSRWDGIVRGMLVTKPANTDMAPLSGTVPNGKFNVFAFFIDADGTLSTAMGTEGSTLKQVKFPVIPEGKACIGFVIINPTGTGNFVGGTTALDDATVQPNAVFVDTVGPFEPTVLVS
jgi:hypothetical protein